jgi:hypothetical protein
MKGHREQKHRSFATLDGSGFLASPCCGFTLKVKSHSNRVDWISHLLLYFLEKRK